MNRWGYLIKNSGVMNQLDLPLPSSSSPSLRTMLGSCHPGFSTKGAQRSLNIAGHDFVQSVLLQAVLTSLMGVPRFRGTLSV